MKRIKSFLLLPLLLTWVIASANTSKHYVNNGNASKKRPSLLEKLGPWDRSGPQPFEAPLGQHLFYYTRINQPVIGEGGPQSCRPLAIDLTSNKLALKVYLPLFSSSMDLFLAIYAPSFSNDFFLFGQDGSLYPLSQGIRPWKVDNREVVDASPLNGIPLSALPMGQYKFLLLVTPHGALTTGSLEDYYLWTTGLVVGVCEKIADLGLNATSVANAPALVQDSEGLLSLGLMGSERATDLSNQYHQSGIFCNVSLEEETSRALGQAMALLDAGDVQAATSLVLDMLTTKRTVTRDQGTNSGGWRDEIGAAFKFWEELLLIGDTEKADLVAEKIEDFFRKNAMEELSNTDLNGSLKIFEEAILLGVKDVEDLARKRIKKIVKEQLENDLKQFDPCDSDPETLKQSIRDLLNSLYAAQFFGIDSAGGPGGTLYDQVVQAVNKAIQVYNNVKQGGSTDTLCGLSMEFTLTGATGFATLKASLHSCNGISGPWSGYINISFSAPEAYSCESSGEMDFSVAPSTMKAEGMQVMSSTTCQMGGGCVFNHASEVIKYEFIFSKNSKFVEVSMGSSGQGSATFTCCNGECHTFDFQPFTIFWGINTINVQLSKYDGCGK